MLLKQIYNKIRIFFILLTFTPLYVMANDLTELAKIVREDAFLSSGQLGIVPLGTQTYLVSVGQGSASTNSADAQVKAMKVARSNALSRLTKFIHGSQMTVEEQFTSIRTVVREGGAPPSVQQKESWQSTIREQGAGLLQNLLDVAHWNNQDGITYYQALGLLIPEK